MGQASGVPDTSQRSWNSIPDLLRAMRFRVSVKDAIGIVDETNGFGLYFDEKTGSGLLSTTLEVGGVL